MRSNYFGRFVLAFAMAASVIAVPLAALGQTNVSLPKNRYKVEDDVKLGREAAVKVEQMFPLVPDARLERYIQDVGDRLVGALPAQFRQPSFDYRFKVVNASDINAFALPGGPMYVNRGMIEAARNEGEMAGVMAHEISHIALRHATAQATKTGSFGSQLRTLGLILGGAILGGQTGAQLGAMAEGVIRTRYSREYETQADVLGARMLADAGYDPRDLANIFQTIAGQQRSRAPEWLSSHPDPGNRYQSINREASRLRVSPNPIKMTREFEWAQARLRELPAARTMAQIEQDYQRGGASQTNTAMAGGRYSNYVQLPSTQTRLYSGSNDFVMQVPANWREFPSTGSAMFAPQGAYGDRGITHGAMVGTFQPQSNNLATETDRFVNGLLQSNNYLRRDGGSSTGYVGNRRGFATVLSGRSPITGRTEIVTVYTASTRNGDVFYLVTVSPDGERSRYRNAFTAMLNSVQFRDFG